MRICSISAPTYPSNALMSGVRSVLYWGMRFLRWTVRMALRSSGVGRSRKNISSKRPFRRSSGRSVVASFAVATMKMLWVRSCIQVRKLPRTSSLVDAPVSLEMVRAFSISSIQRMQGALASIAVSAACSPCMLSP